MSNHPEPSFQMPERNEANLRKHFQADAGPIQWRELELYFASGNVVHVDPALDLVEVAVAMALDDRHTVEGWMAEGLVGILPDGVAAKWSEKNAAVLAVVVSPWILVRSPGES